MSQNRIDGLKTMRDNLGVAIDFIDKSSLKTRILKTEPLHDGYRFLSQNHKSDYLRCYFMHHFGGGYADIKKYDKCNNWLECFNLMNHNDNIYIIGSKENPKGVAFKELQNEETSNKLIQNGFFICRQNTKLSKMWYERLMNKMDEIYDILKKHPSTEPFGGKDYKIGWTDIQGKIFHKLLLDTHDEFQFNKLNILKTGWKSSEAYR